MGRTVRRKGGALWLAAEGANEIETRVQAAIAARGGDAAGHQPFARQAGSVPCLTEKEAPERLKALAARPQNACATTSVRIGADRRRYIGGGGGL